MNRRKFLQYFGLGALSVPVVAKALEEPSPFKMLAKQMRKTVETQEQQVLNNYLVDPGVWYIKDDPKKIRYSSGWADDRGIFGSSS